MAFGRNETFKGAIAFFHALLFPFQNLCSFFLFKQHGYRIKPHGQLVLVSSTPRGASTPSLSTSWSRTTLQ